MASPFALQHQIANAALGKLTPLVVEHHVIAVGMGRQLPLVDGAMSRLMVEKGIAAVHCFVGEGDTVTLNVSPDMLRKQLTIIASWTFSSVGQRDCARFIADRAIDVDALFSHRYRLDQVTEAYTLFDTQTTGKGVFLF